MDLKIQDIFTGPNEFLPDMSGGQTEFREDCIKGLYANIADPDQMPHNVASDQGLHCLLTGFTIKNRIKGTKKKKKKKKN